MSLDRFTSGVITFKFDTSNFKDPDNYFVDFPEQKYPVLNIMSGESGFHKALSALSGQDVVASITSNGIDTDTYGNTISTFYINPEKFLNTKISIVVRVRGGQNNYFKSMGKLRLYQDIFLSLVYYEDSIKDYIQITDGVDFFEEFGSLEDDGNYTGFFKGYLICSKMPETNGKPVQIKANVSFMLGDQILIDTKECIFARPASNDLNLATIRSKAGTTIKDALYKTYSISGLSGVYASCIIPFRNPDATLEKYAWVADADNDLVIKYRINELYLYEVARIDLKEITPNASPAHIAADMEGNVWVCLHDSLSTVRINNITNTIDKYIVCSVANTIENDENKIRPASIDVDVGNNVWISYSSGTYSLVERYNFDGVYLNGFTTSNLASSLRYQFTELVTDLQSNCYVISKKVENGNIVQNSDVVYKITKDFAEPTKINVGGNLGNINLDLAGNIWLTKDINKVVSIGFNGSIREYSLPTIHANKSDYYLSDLEGIATTTDGTILVIDDSRKGIYYFNYSDNPNTFVPKFIRIRQSASTGLIANKLNGYGDWNAFRYINKFQHIYSERYETTKYSNEFKLYSLEDKIYDIRKVNENFNPIEQLKSYRTQEYLLDKDVFFDKFIGTCIGNSDSDSNSPGKLIYEKIANYFDNNANVDSCNVKSLKAINELVDENLFIYNSREFEMPPELNRIFDLLTIKYSKLKGSRNKHEYNFDDRGYFGPIEERDTMFGINKGREVDFKTYIVDISKPLVAFEKYSGTYKFINTKVSQITLSSYDAFDTLVEKKVVPFINDLETLYPLSACDTKWGWGLVLPEGIDDFKFKIPDYYKFFEFVPRYHNKNELKDIGAQTEGIINWSDPQNTIKESEVTSLTAWDKIKSDIIMYTLVKGLSNVK
jgi:hypothetical protein